jgi:hypothetical protein
MSERQRATGIGRRDRRIEGERERRGDAERCQMSDVRGKAKRRSEI